MPGKDGTGPFRANRSAGTATAAGRGRMGGLVSAGPTGYCECPNCGEKVKHNRAEPCTSLKCPKCGTRMIRA